MTPLRFPLVLLLASAIGAMVMVMVMASPTPNIKLGPRPKSDTLGNVNAFAVRMAMAINNFRKDTLVQCRRLHDGTSSNRVPSTSFLPEVERRRNAFVQKATGILDAWVANPDNFPDSRHLTFVAFGDALVHAIPKYLSLASDVHLNSFKELAEGSYPPVRASADSSDDLDVWQDSIMEHLEAFIRNVTSHFTLIYEKSMGSSSNPFNPRLRKMLFQTSKVLVSPAFVAGMLAIQKTLHDAVKADAVKVDAVKVDAAKINTVSRRHIRKTFEFVR